MNIKMFTVIAKNYVLIILWQSPDFLGVLKLIAKTDILMNIIKN